LKALTQPQPLPELQTRPDFLNLTFDQLSFMWDEATNKLIARELGVTEGTVKVHLLAVFRTLDVRNRTAAVLAAQRFLDRAG